MPSRRRLGNYLLRVDTGAARTAFLLSRERAQKRPQDRRSCRSAAVTLIATATTVAAFASLAPDSLELRQPPTLRRERSQAAGDFAYPKNCHCRRHLSNHRCGRAITAKRNYQIWSEGERKRSAVGHATIAICGRMSKRKVTNILLITIYLQLGIVVFLKNERSRWKIDRAQCAARRMHSNVRSTDYAPWSPEVVSAVSE